MVKNYLQGAMDSIAVDMFAMVMKEKMEISREKGRSGWEGCPVEELWKMLREHVEKGDPVDVANLAMMIWHNQNRTID